MKIILASKSIRRKELLKKINLDFEVIDSNFDESKVKKNHNEPKKFCLKLAIKKAEIISRKFRNDLVIGADTIVYYDNQIIGKPRNKLEAIKFLQLLSNDTHQVFTAVAILNNKNHINKNLIDKTSVTFNKLTRKEILYYIDNFQPYDKAGAYGIQDWSSIFVKKINGCFYNVVGFPLPKFYKLFKTITLKK